MTKTELSTTSKNFQTIAQLLERGKDQFAAALPEHITPERMIRVVLTSLRRTPDLLRCEPLSLMKASLEAAQLGLEPDGVLGFAYLVPFGREVQLLPGYKGLIDLCRRSGTISTIDAHCVYEGDRFDFGLGDEPYIKHHPDLNADRRDESITYVYAIAKLRDGGIQRCVMSRKQIDEHCKKYSRGAGRKESPWQTAFPWMAKKTALRQLVKLLPVSVEAQRVIAREEQFETESLPIEKTVVQGLDELADYIDESLGGDDTVQDALFEKADQVAADA